MGWNFRKWRQIFSKIFSLRDMAGNLNFITRNAELLKINVSIYHSITNDPRSPKNYAVLKFMKNWKSYAGLKISKFFIRQFFAFHVKNLVYGVWYNLSKKCSPDSGLSNGVMKLKKGGCDGFENSAGSWCSPNFSEYDQEEFWRNTTKFNVSIYQSIRNNEGSPNMRSELKLVLKWKSYSRLKIFTLWLFLALHFSAFNCKNLV